MQTNPNPQPRHQGFTVVELLVTITIIAVLASLAFVGARKAMESASKAKSVANIRQMTIAHQAFSADNNGAILDWNRTIVNGRRGVWCEHLLITLSPELADNNAFKQSIGDTTARSMGIFADPSALKKAGSSLQKTGHNSWRTYAYNNRIGTYTEEGSEVTPYKKGVKFASQVRYPNKLILFSQRILDGSQHFAFLQPEDGKNGKVLFDLYGGTAPVGFYDGHVAFFAKKNYPSDSGSSINPSTGKAYTKNEWHQHWFGVDQGKGIPPVNPSGG